MNQQPSGYEPERPILSLADSVALIDRDLSLPIIPSESSKAGARGKRRILQIDLYVVMLFDTCARTMVTAPQSGVLRQI